MDHGTVYREETTWRQTQTASATANDCAPPPSYEEVCADAGRPSSRICDAPPPSFHNELPAYQDLESRTLGSSGQTITVIELHATTDTHPSLEVATAPVSESTTRDCITKIVPRLTTFRFPFYAVIVLGNSVFPFMLIMIGIAYLDKCVDTDLIYIPLAFTVFGFAHIGHAIVLVYRRTTVAETMAKGFYLMLAVHTFYFIGCSITFERERWRFDLVTHSSYDINCSKGLRKIGSWIVYSFFVAIGIAFLASLLDCASDDSRNPANKPQENPPSANNCDAQTTEAERLQENDTQMRPTGDTFPR